MRLVERAIHRSGGRRRDLAHRRPEGLERRCLRAHVWSVTGAEARGYVFHLTEKGREKGPGDFKELHQGAIVVGPLLLSVTVLTHPGDTGTVNAALKTVSTARYKAKK